MALFATDSVTMHVSAVDDPPVFSLGSSEPSIVGYGESASLNLTIEDIDSDGMFYLSLNCTRGALSFRNDIQEYFENSHHGKCGLSFEAGLTAANLLLGAVEYTAPKRMQGKHEEDTILFTISDGLSNVVGERRY